MWSEKQDPDHLLHCLSRTHRQNILTQGPQAITLWVYCAPVAGWAGPEQNVHSMPGLLEAHWASSVNLWGSRNFHR